MRRKQKTSKPEKRGVAGEPLTEGIIPRKMDGKRNWASQGDDRVLAFAKRVIALNGIRNRTGLQNIDSGLYAILGRRKLLDRLRFHDTRRDWASMSDEELIGHTRGVLQQHGIGNRNGLRTRAPKLYGALLRRKLADRIGFATERRDWAGMSDDGLVAFAKRFMVERGIRSRWGFFKEDTGLYQTLSNRGLMDRIRFEEGRREWSSLGHGDLVAHARDLIERMGIKDKKGLKAADRRLYRALLRRKLTDSLGLKDIRRDWASLSDEQLLGCARDLMERKGIRNITMLRKVDGGLCSVLRGRDLLGSLKFEASRMIWARFDDADLLEQARRIIDERGIDSKSGLEREHRQLYKALIRRGLLERLGFSDINNDWASMSDTELLSFARRTVGSKGIRNRMGLRGEIPGLYDALLRRRLLDGVGLESRRRFASMDDDALVAFAKDAIAENGFGSRGALRRGDGGLYFTLRKRGLLDAVFSRIEQSREAEGLREVVDALRDF